jgi:hypothetical protein
MKCTSFVPVANCWLLIGWTLLCLPSLPSALAQAPAERTDEIRQYDVFVKNKPVGNVSIRISQAPDGTTTECTDTSVEAKFLFVTYRYEFHGKEIWQSDRLVQIDGRTNDNGTPLQVQAAVDSQRSRIEVQGKEPRSGPPLAMTENYWRLPSAAATAGNFSVIEPDTGIVRTTRLQYIGADSVTVEGRPIACNHYRLTGEAAAELWFDGQGRLVLQQTVEQGYATEQRLVRIRPGAEAPSGGQASLVGYQN